MLLRFGTSNAGSIKDYQELSLAASSLSDEGGQVFETSHAKHGVLPVVALYGANASGKSTILRAIQFLRSGVVKSHKTGDSETETGREPFLLDKKFRLEPSQFDCDFLLNDVRYHYGFIVDDKKVHEEWLYAYPQKHRQIWFHRNREKGFLFGRELKGKNKTIEALTRDNSLFLSAAAQNNHEQLTPISEYFQKKFRFLLDHELPNEIVLADRLKDEKVRNAVVGILRFSDLGITGARVDDQEIDKRKLKMYKDLFKVVAKNTEAGDDELKKSLDMMSHKFQLSHKGKNGEDIYLDFNSESRGTQTLIAVLPAVLKTLALGDVLFIDEFDTSMHSLVSAFIIRLFTSKQSNPNCAQLVFTTHDTNLLCEKHLLRRDEIWFTQKTKDGSTHLYPLTDIKTRKTDNIEKGYLQGRFGAVPFIGDVEALFDIGKDA
ncbi:MAG TPA: ATP-binding protein [Gammaproteobacteria bacterium]